MGANKAMKAITNARIIVNEGVITGKALIYDETIKGIVPETSLAEYKVKEVLDAEKRYLAPGFIDIHVHGCAGHDTMDGTAIALEAISSELASTGVTAFLPTTMT